MKAWNNNLSDSWSQVTNMASAAAPYFPEVGVIGLVPDRWEGVWQPRHQVMSRLAQYFNVVWVTPAKGWRESLLQQTESGFPQVEHPSGKNSFTVYRSGRTLPKLYRPEWIANWFERLRLKQARLLLRDRGCTKVVLYLWRPEFAPSLDLVDHDLVCYHIDDEYTFSVTEQPLSKSEYSVITRAHQVFIHSPALLEKKGGLNKHTKFVPNGVDYRTYASTQPEPEDLKSIGHPRIGYIGVVKSQMDFDLLLTLTQRHPHWSFVIVGPRGHLEERDRRIIEMMEKRANVFFLGGKPVEALPAYVQHLDVCLMCYRVNDYTKYIYPLKLHEYLASGHPVVGASINSLQEFSRVVALAHTEDEWSSAIEAALRQEMNTVEQIDARRTVAQKHDWEALVAIIAGTMCARLGPEYQQRFDQIVRPNASTIVTG